MEAIAETLLLLTGRQTGKTETGAWWLLDDFPAGEQRLLVAPTYRIGLAPLRRMRELAKPLGGRWNRTDGVLRLPGERLVWVRSVDRPDATRGLDAIERVWVDEATLISEAAWVATQPVMSTSRSPKVLLTCTPKGKRSWVYRDVWLSDEPGTVRLRFRTDDSPVVNPRVVERMRKGMTASSAAQELDAKFLDAEMLPFPPEVVDLLFGRKLKRRGTQWALGLDLAKQRDYCALVAMNEFGEAWCIDHWNHTAWPDSEKRILARAKEFQRDRSDFVIVYDEGYGHGYGNSMGDYLERCPEVGKNRLHPIKTGMAGTKADLIEALSRDAEHEVVHVDPGDVESGFKPAGWPGDMRTELLNFVGERKVVAGVERIVYPGPVSEDEHDDWVIALALANWGRVNAWSTADPLGGDFSAFSAQRPERRTTGARFGGFGSVGGSSSLY